MNTQAPLTLTSLMLTHYTHTHTLPSHVLTTLTLTYYSHTHTLHRWHSVCMGSRLHPHALTLHWSHRVRELCDLSPPRASSSLRVW